MLNVMCHKYDATASNCHHLYSLTMHMVHLVFDTLETCKNIPWVIKTSSSFSLFRVYKIWAVNLLSYQNPSVAAYKLLQRLHHLLPVLCLFKVGVTSSVSFLYKKKRKKRMCFSSLDLLLCSNQDSYLVFPDPFLWNCMHIQCSTIATGFNIYARLCWRCIKNK